MSTPSNAPTLPLTVEVADVGKFIVREGPNDSIVLEKRDITNSLMRMLPMPREAAEKILHPRLVAKPKSRRQQPAKEDDTKSPAPAK